MQKWFHLCQAILFGGALLVVVGCNSNKSGPAGLLDTYFASAMKQDYGTTYTCYYNAYKAKVGKEEFIRHRKEASVLQGYKIVSLTQTSNTAQADVILTFGPSQKLKRSEPAIVKTREEMVKEDGEWKIKVW